ncbi:MAG TPA: cellulose biosynthesis protein CelD, partial [Myxococcaceae bacterium]|nr:cellulose biosynthesis protein CelD [Myxococcaceae bacterium]
MYAQPHLEVQPAAAPLRVDMVSDPRGFAALRPEWDELLEASSASIFCSWEWLYPWFARVGWSR